MMNWTQRPLEAAQVIFWQVVIRLEELALVHRDRVHEGIYYGQMLVLGACAYAVGRVAAHLFLAALP